MLRHTQKGAGYWEDSVSNLSISTYSAFKENRIPPISGKKDLGFRLCKKI